MNFKINLLLSVVSLVGCTSVLVQESGHVGKCLEIINTSYVSVPKLDRAYSGKYMLVSEKYQPLSSSRHIEFIKRLDPKTKIEIDKVIYNEPINWHPYLRVTVNLLDSELKSNAVDIPTCAPYHPQEKWIVGCPLDPDLLEFDPGIIRECDL